MMRSPCSWREAVKSPTPSRRITTPSTMRARWQTPARFPAYHLLGGHQRKLHRGSQRSWKAFGNGNVGSAISVTWGASTAGSSCTVSYNLYRSTTSGFTPSSSNQIAPDWQARPTRIPV